MLPPRKLFRIGEVMRYSGLSRQTVHNYTSLGLIAEADRTEAGHRLYDEAVFERLRRIEDLKGRMTLQEIRLLFVREETGGVVVRQVAGQDEGETIPPARQGNEREEPRGRRDEP